MSQVRAVELVRPAEPQAPGWWTQPAVWWQAGAAVGVGALAAWWWRTRRPATQGYLLARVLMRIGPRTGATLRALARAIDAEPVALVLSRSVFERAAVTVGGKLPEARVDRARRRVFGV